MSTVSSNRKIAGVFLMLLCLIVTQKLMAASFTVKKVKGRNALIEYTGPLIENGQTYKIARGEESSGNNHRGNFAILREISFSNLGTTISGVSAGRASRLSFILGYGWNHENIEYAPLLGLSTVDTGNGSNMTFTLGGIFDYNFQHNVPEIKSVLGMGTELTYAKTNAANGGDSPSTTGVFLGGFWKWFVFGTSTCLRMDLGYQYSKSSGISESTQTGFLGKGAFAVYF
ncbi:MAG: hypothetical protein AABY64_05780 [Bdellovibrionota bacterium]